MSIVLYFKNPKEDQQRSKDIIKAQRQSMIKDFQKKIFEISEIVNYIFPSRFVSKNHEVSSRSFKDSYFPKVI